MVRDDGGMALWEANAGLRPAVGRPLASLRSALTWRHAVFALTLAVYAALTIMIITGSPIDTLDEKIVALHLHARWPGINRFMLDYVMLGQRAPSTLLALPWFVWLCHRHRTFTPLIRLATGLLLLNISVGIVKIVTGRYGPLRTTNAHHVLAGGNIFPSGHVSNAVVLYGVMAMSVYAYRKTAIALAVWVCTTVGLTTLYLNTHWFSDVVGAWLAGGLVLMVLPRCVPVVERVLRAVVAGLRRLVGKRLAPSPEPAPSHSLRPLPVGATAHVPVAAARTRRVATVGTWVRGKPLQSASRTDSTIS
jgi:membrane-associated phospholipid phosphatase